MISMRTGESWFSRESGGRVVDDGLGRRVVVIESWAPNVVAVGGGCDEAGGGGVAFSRERAASAFTTAPGAMADADEDAADDDLIGTIDCSFCDCDCDCDAFDEGLGNIER